MTSLPEFFRTQHNLNQRAVLDESNESTLFLTENPAGEQFLVELFSPQTRGALQQAQAAGQLHHRYIAPLVGTGTTAQGQEFLVRRALPGEQLGTVLGGLNQEAATAVFGPLAQAVDYLLGQNQAGFAAHALNPNRIIVTNHRTGAYLASAGPAGAQPQRAEKSQVLGQFAQIVRRAHPQLAQQEYSSAGAVLDALRGSHRPSQQDYTTQQIPRVNAPAPQPHAQHHFGSPNPQQNNQFQHNQQNQQPQQFGAPQQGPQQPPQQGPQPAPQQGPQQPPQQQPQQYGPNQGFGYGMPPQQQQQPQQQPQQFPNNGAEGGPQKKSNKATIIALCALLAVILIAGGGTAWFLKSRPAWSDEEQALADAYPQLVGNRSGDSGFGDTTCSSREPEAGQVAKISCTGEDFSYAIAGFASVDDRDAAVPSFDPVTLGNDTCELDSYEIEGDEPTYFMAVDGESEAFLVWGPDAENARLNLPVCGG
ncbi:serine/threonine protein kinase [Corynebacterium sp.]|uniref:serine/threonine protein kinase n=1 Tax=Corynebacterium sp. TaxID=1720 RepID=UPI0026DAECD9|nr:serine/threonine protein kinase [Corynebacterium sp.]MDO5032246.1 serine/threonine protein kinase [Corynebacterium sp.]